MKRKFNILILGHVDHGKSSLLSAMSLSFSKMNIAPLIPYEQIDLAGTHQDERLRLSKSEITINGSKADYVFTDYPSHHDLIKSIITTPKVDGILLVVSATDGPMPQTHEHLKLVRALGVKKSMVFLNKVDMVSESLQELVSSEVKQILTESGFNSNECQIVKGSALLARKCGCGKRECSKCGFLFRILDSLEQCFEDDDKNKHIEPLFVIEEVNSTPLNLLFCKGKLLYGTLKKDQSYKLFSKGRVSKIILKGLEKEGKTEDMVEGEYNLNVFIEGVEYSEVEKGSIIFLDGENNFRKIFKALVYLFRKEEEGRELPINKGNKVIISLLQRELKANVVDIEEKESLLPGDSSFVKLEFEEEIFYFNGLTFFIREDDRNVGIGRLVDLGEKNA